MRDSVACNLQQLNLTDCMLLRRILIPSTYQISLMHGIEYAVIWLESDHISDDTLVHSSNIRISEMPILTATLFKTYVSKAALQVYYHN